MTEPDAEPGVDDEIGGDYGGNAAAEAAAGDGRSMADADDGDFAAEHASPTHADDMPGGPEAADEDDSPAGLAGAD